MEITIELKSGGEVTSHTFEHLSPPKEIIARWIEVDEPVITLKVKPTGDPSSAHPGIDFRMGGELHVNESDWFTLQISQRDPNSTYQIGSVDAVQIKDNYDEHTRSEFIIAFKGKEGNKVVQIIPTQGLLNILGK